MFLCRYFGIRHSHGHRGTIHKSGDEDLRVRFSGFTGKSSLPTRGGKLIKMEEAAITIVEDAASPPAKTVQPSLPTNITALQHLQQLPHQQQQQLVTRSLQRQQQQQSPKCGSQTRFQQQPVSPQRSDQQPPKEHQVARVAYFTEGPADAVDRFARSSSQGSCTELKDVQPEHSPVHHPTPQAAVINARAVNESFGVMEQSIGHVHLSSHVSPRDVTTVQRSTTNLSTSRQIGSSINHVSVSLSSGRRTSRFGHPDDPRNNKPPKTKNCKGGGVNKQHLQVSTNIPSRSDFYQLTQVWLIVGQKSGSSSGSISSLPIKLSRCQSSANSPAVPEQHHQQIRAVHQHALCHIKNNHCRVVHPTH